MSTNYSSTRSSKHSTRHSTTTTEAGKATARRILLLSAYDAHSHQQWRHTLCDMFPDDHWTCLSLPPRHFAWRVRGNSLSWAFNHRQTLTDNYDLLIVTSLTDLSSLRGFVPELTCLPTLVYFHENQFGYPTNTPPSPPAHPAATQAPDLTAGHPDAKQTNDQSNKVNAQVLSLYTALCADHIAFNSQWNQRSFFDGLEKLLTKLPDHVPDGLMQQLRARSSVLAVPLPDRLFPENANQNNDTRHLPGKNDTLQIVWNHRHEYDKGPALLLAIVQRLVSQGLSFRLHLLGQRFRNEPEEFSRIRTLLAQHYTEFDIAPGIDKWLPSRKEYEQTLTQSDIVLSTALHDFQGLSILEAMALGCIPLAPAALAYPEYIDADYLYDVSGCALSEQAAAACEKIITWHGQWQHLAVRPPAIDVSQFSTDVMREPWAEVMTRLLAP